MNSKTFLVTVHETRARTYQITSCRDEDDAIEKYKRVPYQRLVEDECIDEDITGVFLEKDYAKDPSL